MPAPRLPLLSQLSVKLTNDSKNGSSFDPSTVFEKWAAVEVIDRSSIPDRMKSHQLTGGFYSVFEYNGPTSGAPEIFNHIFSISLPNSGYKIDNREYFEVLKEDYVPTDQNAQEKIWIPIKWKHTIIQLNQRGQTSTSYRNVSRKKYHSLSHAIEKRTNQYTS